MEDWYIDAGIPHRRGYLLYGPPGTGKSKLIYCPFFPGLTPLLLGSTIHALVCNNPKLKLTNLQITLTNLGR